MKPDTKRCMLSLFFFLWRARACVLCRLLHWDVLLYKVVVIIIVIIAISKLFTVSLNLIH